MTVKKLIGWVFSQGPIVKNDSKTYYWGGFCVPFESEPVNISVRLPSSGFAPGQEINVTVEVDNKSNVNPVFDVKLVQVIVGCPTLFTRS